MPGVASVLPVRKFARGLNKSGTRFFGRDKGSVNPDEEEEEDDELPPPPPSPDKHEKLPFGWRAVPDPRSGRTYYAGPGGAVQWDHPGKQTVHPPPPAPTGGTGSTPGGASAAKREEMEPTGKLLSTGRLEFPNSRRAASRWVRVAPIPKVGQDDIETGADNTVHVADSVIEGRAAVERAIDVREEALRRVTTHMLTKWNLPPPSVLISVNGGAGTLDISPKQATVFRHGLLDAARQASAGGDEDQTKTVAWVISGGTDSGVMRLAGHTMHGLDTENDVQIPLIGVAAWGVISQRAHMDPRAVPGYREPMGGGGSGQKKSAGSYLYSSKPDPPSQLARAKTAIQLEPNHSNFVFVDNASEGANALYSETDIRASLEDYIARGAPNGMDSLFGYDEDGDKFPPPPMVVLVVGGGLGTFKMTLESLQQRRPVVILSDSAGVAKDIYDYCTTGSLDMSVERKYGQGDKSAEEVAMEYLPAIKELGEVEVGVRKAKMLTFFSLSKDFDDPASKSEDLSTQILNAILSDCESTGEAIVHAVRWRNATVIRKQLEGSSESDPQGIARAFQNALLGRDRSAIKVLIQYNVDVKHVSLKGLIGRNDTNSTLMPFTWGGGFAWKSSWGKKGMRTATVMPGSGDAPKTRRGRRVFREAKAEDDIRFCDTNQKSMPPQIYQWVREDNEKRREERADGTKPGEWMQDELDDIAVRTLLRTKDEQRSYEEIKDEMRALNRRKADEENADGIPKYPAPKLLKTDWSDLMCWAVCQGEPDIAQLLWVKTREPLRYAIWASQIAGHLALLENTAAGQVRWRSYAHTYEQWATELVNEW